MAQRAKPYIRVDGKLTATYKAWQGMKYRCRRPTAPQYPRYGGRGIGYIPAWDSYEQFLADMGERPEGTSLDRVDNDAGYSPCNCRWGTPLEQSRNRRVCKELAFDGESLFTWSWAEKLGITKGAFEQRMHRHKVDPIQYPYESIFRPRRK